jgi:hypothetical protein
MKVINQYPSNFRTIAKGPSLPNHKNKATIGITLTLLPLTTPNQKKK